MARFPLARFALLAIAWLGAAGPALAQSEVAQPELQIRSLRTAGSGCPARSVAVVIEGNLASVLFSAYTVTATPARPVALRNCTVAIGLAVPDGRTLAVASIDWQGVLVLDAGSSARFARMFALGGLRKLAVTESFERPGISDFRLHDEISSPVISGCRTREASLLASTSLTLLGGGTASVDSVDLGGAAMRIGLRLGTCKRASPPAPAR